MPRTSPLVRKVTPRRRPELRPRAELLEGRALMAVVVDSAMQIGGLYQDYASEVATDSAGNVYVAGDFAGTVDFDPGDGVTNVSGIRLGSNEFLAKYDASGGLLWASVYASDPEGAGGFGFSGLAVDNAQNVFISGNFTGKADFDLAGSHADNSDIKTSTGPSYASDAFILKVDIDGRFAWVQTIPRAITSSQSSDLATDIAVDGAGSVYTTGKLNGNASDATRIYASKHDTNGNLLWLKQTQGAVDTSNAGNSIAVDGNGNVLIAGDINGKVDFDPSLTRATYVTAANSAFVWKLTAAGNFSWVRTFNAGRFSHVHAADLALDGSGNIYTAGDFQDTVDFDPGKGTYRLTAGTTQGTFISKLTTNGDFAWARNVGGSGWFNGLALDPVAGVVYVSGDFAETADFDPGAGTTLLTSRGDRDVFVASLTMSTGAFGGVVQMGGAGFDRAYGLALDASGTLYAVGFFEGTAGFGGTTPTLTSRGNLDGFLARLHSGPAALLATSSAPAPLEQSITQSQARPVLARALAHWRARGADTSALGRVDLAIADLGGNRLGEASGSTIALDDNAAGWGWNVGRAAGRGRKAIAGRMSLLAAMVHEVGHLLGHDHAEGGVMAETLAPGVRSVADPSLVAAPTSGRDHPLPSLAQSPSRLAGVSMRGFGRRLRAFARG